MLLEKRTKTRPLNKDSVVKLFYRNYVIGCITILTAVALPFILPILGTFLFPFLMIGGALAIVIDKQIKLWVRICTLVVISLVMYFIWDWYAFQVFQFTEGINQH